MATWKRDFGSGLIILLPILVVAYVIYWLYSKIADLPIPVDNPFLRVTVTLVVFVLVVFAIGYLMRTALGAVMERTLDDMMNQVPGLRVVYNASKMAVETALGGTDELQTPVKVETWDDLRMTAFKTGKTTPNGDDVLFLPTSPNITSGYVIEVPPDRYEETDESVEDALTRVLSAGFGDTNERSIGGQFVDLTGDEDEDDEEGEDDTGGDWGSGPAHDRNG